MVSFSHGDTVDVTMIYGLCDNGICIYAYKLYGCVFQEWVTWPTRGFKGVGKLTTADGETVYCPPEAMAKKPTGESNA